mmetsp:Transcript_4926/g.10221  ORF Transcript_4926/g.10221 Transcript_4926/m.10221 type:complete len:234 (+) Transcript_4926:592-1293(+)
MFGNDTCDVLGVHHIECWVENLHVLRSNAVATHEVGNLLSTTLLDRNIRASGHVQVNSGGGCNNVDRNTVLTSNNTNRKGTNLVSSPAICSNTVSSIEYNIDLSTVHQQSCCAVRNEVHGHALTHELPSRETSTLESRPGLADPCVDVLALVKTLVDHTKCSADVHGREASSVANVQDVGSLRHNLCAMLRHGDVNCHILIRKSLSLFQDKCRKAISDFCVFHKLHNALRCPH